MIEQIQSAIWDDINHLDDRIADLDEKRERLIGRRNELMATVSELGRRVEKATGKVGPDAYLYLNIPE